MNETTNTTDRAIVIDGLGLDEYRDMGHAIQRCMRTLDKLSERAGTDGRRRFYTNACDSLDAILGGLADVFGEACEWRADVWTGDLYPYPRFRVEGDLIVTEPPSEPARATEADAAKLATNVFGTKADDETNDSFFAKSPAYAACLKADRDSAKTSLPVEVSTWGGPSRKVAVEITSYDADHSESEVDMLRDDATRVLFAEECRDRGLELG